MSDVMDCEWAYKTRTQLGTLNSFIWSGSLPLQTAINQLEKVSHTDKGIMLKVPSGFFTVEKTFKTPADAIAEIRSWVPDFVVKGSDSEWAFKQRSEFATANPFIWSGSLSFDKCIEALEKLPASETRGILVKIPSGIATMEETLENKEAAIEYIKKHSPKAVKQGAISKIASAKEALAILEEDLAEAQAAVDASKAKSDTSWVAAKAEAEKTLKELEDKQMHAERAKVDAVERADELERSLTAQKSRQQELTGLLPTLKKTEEEAKQTIGAATLGIYSQANPDYCIGLSSKAKNGSHIQMTKVTKPMPETCLWQLDGGVLRPKSDPKFGLCVLQSGVKNGGAMHMWETATGKQPDKYSYWVVEHGLLKTPAAPVNKDGSKANLAIHVCKDGFKEGGGLQIWTIDGSDKNSTARWKIDAVS